MDFTGEGMFIKYAYLGVLAGFLIALLISTIICFMKKKKIANQIAAINIHIILLILAVAVGITTLSLRTAYYHIGLFYVLLDWMMMWMLAFTLEYTKFFPKHRSIFVILNVLGVLDTVLLILNAEFHFLFEVASFQGMITNFYRISQFKLPFLFHFLLFYTICGTVLSFIGWKAFHVGKFYRRRYSSIFMWFITSVLVSIICLNSSYVVDFSIIWYSIVALSICYYTLFFMPRGLVEQILSQIHKDSVLGTVCFDVDDHCVFMNNRASDYFEANHDRHVLSVIYRDWLKTCPDSKLDEYRWEEQKEIGGEVHFYEIISRKIFDDDDNYVARYFTITDRTDEIKNYKEQQYKATHDALTGLYNREYFFERVEEMLAKNPRTKYLMLVSNIRDFKLINELFGVDRGDEILIAEADVLRKYAFEECMYCRMYGDRFAMLIEARLFDEEQFKRILSSLQNAFTNNVFSVHFMLGVYTVTNHKESPGIMCDKAYLALSSLAGKREDMVAYYDATVRDAEIYNAQLESDFPAAIEAKEFCFYLQPQTTSDGKLLGAEALVRWNHPKYGFMNPGRFVEVFENSGQIYRLDYEIWRMVAEKLKEWKNKGREDIYISVNISAKDFYFLDIYETLVTLVTAYDINPKNMNLEITETAVINDFAKTAEVLKKLREFGFEIEIDDFGSGYSSLNMLKNIEADVIKMDMEFLREAEDNSKSKDILSTMIRLSKDLGMRVVTEGVETEEQVQMLKAMDNDIYQGYYFSRPISVLEFEAKYGI